MNDHHEDERYEQRPERPLTVDIVRESVEILRDGDVILGDGDWDYLAADLLEILAALHDQTGIDLEGLPQVRYFAETIVEERG